MLKCNLEKTLALQILEFTFQIKKSTISKKYLISKKFSISKKFWISKKFPTSKKFPRNFQFSRFCTFPKNFQCISMVSRAWYEWYEGAHVIGCGGIRSECEPNMDTFKVRVWHYLGHYKVRISVRLLQAYSGSRFERDQS